MALLAALSSAAAAADYKVALGIEFDGEHATAQLDWHYATSSL